MNRWAVIILSFASFPLYAWKMGRWLSTVNQEPVKFAAYSPFIRVDNDPRT